LPLQSSLCLIGTSTRYPISSIFSSGYVSKSEQDLEDADFIQKAIDNDNLIIVKPKYDFNQECKLDLTKTTNYVYSLSKDRNILIKNYKHKSGIYLLHNNVNGKQYVGSGTDLGIRLANYYYPSRLEDNRYISRSILKYGHASFSVVILYVSDEVLEKNEIIRKEQEYMDLHKPVLNLNPIAGSSTGFKHSEESKKLMSELRKGKTLSEATKQRLSELFSGELNPF
jgi:hypothetical protein